MSELASQAGGSNIWAALGMLNSSELMLQVLVKQVWVIKTVIFHHLFYRVARKDAGSISELV